MTPVQPDPPDYAPDLGHPRRWLILGVLVLSLIIVVLDNTVLNVALETLADPDAGLGAEQSQLQWMINAYTLVFAGLLFACGVIGDRIGRRKLLLLGLGVFGCSSLLSAYAQSPGQLIGYRALMGAGAALMMPSTLSLLRVVFSEREFPRALGVWTGAVGVGGALGPVVAGSLLERFWWGSIFLINVPIAAFGIVMIRLLAPESRGRQGRPDLVGMALSVVALVLLTYGIIKAGDSGSWTRVEVFGPIIAGLAGLVAFVLWELRTPHPSLDMRLFRNARFASASILIALIFFAMLGLFFFMTFYIQVVRGRTPIQAGLLFLAFGISTMIFAPLSSTMVGRFGSRVVGIAGLTLVTCASLTVSRLEADTPLWLVAVVFAVQAMGMANLMPPAMTTLMSSVPREQAGVASALGNTLRQVGGALGVAVLGTVMAQAYRGRLTEAAPGLHGAARESIVATYAGVADQLSRGRMDPSTAHDLLRAANESFVGAMHVTAYCCAGVGLLGMLLVGRYFPRKTQTGSDSAPESRAEPVSEAVAER
ncbi:MFS transporter [Pimelobacter simplex]|uniref:MFS transporter n=1 Tax=Nocardioides simplex TaxID=2045 RepID=UPI0019322CEB|nr:MFS transporter [Pimelobacter simplex]